MHDVSSTLGDWGLTGILVEDGLMRMICPLSPFWSIITFRAISEKYFAIMPLIYWLSKYSVKSVLQTASSTNSSTDSHWEQPPKRSVYFVVGSPLEWLTDAWQLVELSSQAIYIMYYRSLILSFFPSASLDPTSWEPAWGRGYSPCWTWGSMGLSSPSLLSTIPSPSLLKHNPSLKHNPPSPPSRHLPHLISAIGLGLY